MLSSDVAVATGFSSSVVSFSVFSSVVGSAVVVSLFVDSGLLGLFFPQA